MKYSSENISNIDKTKTLSKEENLELLRKVKQGDLEAKTKLIESNLRLVKSIAKRYASIFSIEDAIQIGSIGLILACNEFDETINKNFSTFSKPA